MLFLPVHSLKYAPAIPVFRNRRHNRLNECIRLLVFRHLHTHSPYMYCIAAALTARRSHTQTHTHTTCVRMQNGGHLYNVAYLKNAFPARAPTSTHSQQWNCILIMTKRARRGGLIARVCVAIKHNSPIVLVMWHVMLRVAAANTHSTKPTRAHSTEYF